MPPPTSVDCRGNETPAAELRALPSLAKFEGSHKGGQNAAYERPCALIYPPRIPRGRPTRDAP